MMKMMMVKMMMMMMMMMLSTKTFLAPQGTPLYMAPELFEMESLSSSMTSKDYVYCDVFALGVVIHEILCGEHPFEGEYRAT